MKQIKIGIVEDHPFTRMGMVSALKPHKHIRVLFDVSNGKEALNALKTFRPDILLLDIKMPVISAPELLDKIKLKYPNIQVIIVSAFFLDDYVVECFKLGVKAFLPKGDPIEKTIKAIETVYDKGLYTDAVVTKMLTRGLAHKNVAFHFTQKELEIIKLLCEGKSLQQAADLLKLSIDGLNYHLRKIRRDTGLKSKTEIIDFAIANDLVRIK